MGPEEETHGWESPEGSREGFLEQMGLLAEALAYKQPLSRQTGKEEEEVGEGQS